MGNSYDLAFIGAGPSSIFAILNLINNGYKGKICLIEKGKSLTKRQPNEVLNGFCGAGTFSDSKLSSALDVGGVIPNLTQKDLIKYEDYILETLNKFKEKTNNKTPLKWDITNDYDTKDSGLNWNQHKTCHIGTENGQAIYSEIEKFISSKSNIDILFELEVLNITKYDDKFIVELSDGTYIETDKVILATGQKNTLPSKVINDFNLPSKPRAFQVGVRVVDKINPEYEEIIKANYDFKFTKSYIYDNVKVRVRTFCCNSGNAHVCAEKASEGFTCFNGHAFKTPDPTNNTVNYGIMCEVEGIDKFDSKETQIQLMKVINRVDGWKLDNFYGVREDAEPNPRRKLLDGFNQLKGLYPKEILDSLTDFISRLNSLVDLSEARYLYPEVKLSGLIPDLNYNNFETKVDGLYMIGDCAVSRGITKASITGLIFSDSILKEKLNDFGDESVQTNLF